MAVKDQFYFENMCAAAGCSCKAAEYLAACLVDFHPQQVKTMLDTLHEYEHAGDLKKHEMSAALATAFVTPIDREDLALISQNIDDVTDSIEEVLQQLYMYQILTITPEAITFAKKIVGCCRLMKEMLEEFIRFKKSEKLHNMVVELNRLEEECDELYMQAMVRLSERCKDILTLVSWREIYGKMEKCADACENVGDCVDTVVMKNT